MFKQNSHFDELIEVFDELIEVFDELIEVFDKSIEVFDKLIEVFDKLIEVILGSCKIPSSTFLIHGLIRDRCLSKTHLSLKHELQFTHFSIFKNR